jgi:uncharacterized protein
MLIGILSDTHGHGEAASAAGAILRAGGASFFIHCGDVGSQSVLDELTHPPSAFVWGNTDADRVALGRYARSLDIRCLGVFGELELGERRFAVTHGDDPRLVRRVLGRQEHDYLLVGHTHVRSDHRSGRVRVINPGALYRTRERTVALLDTERDQLQFLPVPL